MFRAIPTKWKNKKLMFKNLRAYAGVYVSAETDNGRIYSFSISSDKETTIFIINTFGSENLTFIGNQGNIIKINCPLNGLFPLTFKGKITYKPFSSI